MCVRSEVYFPPPDGQLAPQRRALCDYVYLSGGRGPPESLLTFRNLAGKASAMQIFPAFWSDIL